MRITRTMTVLCVLLTLSALSFAGVPKTVSYQGRLTNSGGTPVANGTYSIKFSLWSDPTLGTESWSETQMVTVTDGLFSTELGSISPLSFGINCPGDCNEWLQIEATIGGLPVVMSPRLHLSAIPWSLVSRSLYSEEVSGLARSRGIVGKKPAGGMTGSRMLLDADSDGDGHAEYNIEDSVTTESASREFGHDLDNDGIPDLVVAGAVGASSANFQVGDKPTQTQFGTLIESSVNLIDDRALLGLRSYDALPIGVPEEHNIALETNGDSASVTLRSLNGLPPGTPWEDNIRLATTGTSSTIGINEVLPYATLQVNKSGDLPVRFRLAADMDGDGLEDRTILSSIDGSGAKNVIRGGMSGSTTGTIRMAATPDSASSVMECDSDGDGVPDVRRLVLVNGSVGSTSKLSLQRYGGGLLVNESSTELSAIESRDILKTYFETGDIPTQERVLNSSGAFSNTINTKGSGETFRVLSEATDSAGLVIEGDADGDGHAEARGIITQKPGTINPKGSISTMYDYNDDGSPDNTAEMLVTPTKSSLAIKTKGTGAQRIAAGGDCDDSDASLYAERDANGNGNAESRANLAAVFNGNVVIGATTDLNDDGIDENEASFVVTPTTSSVAINTKGTGADKGRVISSTTYPDSAVHVISTDSDGDGINNGTIWQKVDNTDLVSTMAQDVNNDGGVDNRIQSVITPTTCSVAINQKGTGADKNRTISSTTYPDSAVQIISSDQDGDGNREMSLESKLKTFGLLPPSAVHRLIADSDDDGLEDNTAEMTVTPTKSSLAIKTKGLPVQRTAVTLDGVVDTARMQCVFDANDDGTPESQAQIMSDPDGAGIAFDYQGIQARVGGRKGWDGTIKGHVRLDNGPDMNVLFESDGDGYVATRFGIGVLEPANPLEHSSGAHLTAGGTWTNASDENLKENFEKVDGSEILEKIEDLPVSEWNYKAEGDDVKHIGPTAQDFREAFDLGNNDKSISTIDPSGVALVAIKELAKQNKDLKKKNADLEEKLNELQKQIEKLASAIKK